MFAANIFALNYGLYFFSPSSTTKFKTWEKLTDFEDVFIIFA